MSQDLGLVLGRQQGQKIIIGGREGGLRLFALTLEEARHVLAWVDALDYGPTPPALLPVVERLRQWRAEPIVVTTADIRGSTVRTGFAAAQDISVDRLELLEEINANYRAGQEADREARPAEASKRTASAGRASARQVDTDDKDPAFANVEPVEAFAPRSRREEVQGNRGRAPSLHPCGSASQRQHVRSPGRGALHRAT